MTQRHDPFESTQRTFLLECGVALHQFGTPTHRMELALGHLAAPQSKARLQSLLDDEDATVSYYAAWALRQLGKG